MVLGRRFQHPDTDSNTYAYSDTHPDTYANPDTFGQQGRNLLFDRLHVDQLYSYRFRHV